MRRFKDQVRFSIMGLCCAVKHHLLQAKPFHQHAYSCACQQGFMEASCRWRGLQVLWSTCQPGWLEGVNT